MRLENVQDVKVHLRNGHLLRSPKYRFKTSSKPVAVLATPVHMNIKLWFCPKPNGCLPPSLLPLEHTVACEGTELFWLPGPSIIPLCLFSERQSPSIIAWWSWYVWKIKQVAAPGLSPGKAEKCPASIVTLCLSIKHSISSKFPREARNVRRQLPSATSGAQLKQVPSPASHSHPYQVTRSL